MPIANKEHLFKLIKSLNKAEKRNFKLFAKRINNKNDVLFLQLFNVLDKLEEYDEKKVLKKIPGLQKKQIANITRHLYGQILKSLRLISAEKFYDFHIREQLDFAKILYGKGLYFQSLKLISRLKAKQFPLQHDLVLLEIIEFEKFIEERHITRSRTVKNKMETLIEEAEHKLEKVGNTIKLSNLKLKIHGMYIKAGHIHDEAGRFMIKKYFYSNLPKLTYTLLSPYEKVYWHQCFVWYNYILLNFPLCYRHAIKWSQTFDEHPEMKSEDPDLYMRGLHYEMTALYNMNYHSELVKSMNRYDRFADQYGHQFNTNSKIIHFLYGYSAKMNLHFMQGDFDESLKIVQPILDGLHYYAGQIDHHRNVVFYYRIACLYFAADKADRALKYLNQIIDNKDGYLRTDIQCYARLLRLIIHFELGHTQLLEYMVQSVKRFFQKTKDINKIQTALLYFIKSNLHKPKNQLKHAYKDLLVEINGLAADRNEARTFTYLDLQVWLTSKLEGKSIQMIVQTQNEQNLR